MVHMICCDGLLTRSSRTARRDCCAVPWEEFEGEHAKEDARKALPHVYGDEGQWDVVYVRRNPLCARGLPLRHVRGGEAQGDAQSQTQG